MLWYKLKHELQVLKKTYELPENDQNLMAET